MATTGEVVMVSETVITQTTKTTGTVIRFDRGWLITIPSIIKAVPIISALMGLICILSSNVDISRSRFYSFVAINNIWISLVLYLFYMFHLIERSYFMPWLIIEFGYSWLFAAFNFIAGVLMCTCGYCNGAAEAWAAASFFAFLNCVLLSCDGVYNFRRWKSGESPQGIRIVTKTKTRETLDPSEPPRIP